LHCILLNEALRCRALGEQIFRRTHPSGVGSTRQRSQSAFRTNSSLSTTHSPNAFTLVKYTIWQITHTDTMCSRHIIDTLYDKPPSLTHCSNLIVPQPVFVLHTTMLLLLSMFLTKLAAEQKLTGRTRNQVIATETRMLRPETDVFI